MHTSKKPIGFWSAVSMGIGSMVGAGIFALLGEASAISGSAVYISFIIGGIIALFSGYSLGKLGGTLSFRWRNSRVPDTSLWSWVVYRYYEYYALFCRDCIFKPYRQSLR